MATKKLDTNISQSIHTELKLITEPIHKKIEEVNILGKENPSMEDYIQFIFITLKLLIPLEKKLDLIFKANPQLNYEFKLRSHLLISDLENCHVSSQDINKLTISSHLPSISTPSQAFGALYVIEGSKLGGQFLCKKLSKIHGEKIKNCMSYLWGEGHKTYFIWKEFLNQLEHYYIHHLNDKQCILNSALDVFKFFEKEFQLAAKR